MLYVLQNTERHDDKPNNIVNDEHLFENKILKFKIIEIKYYKHLKNNLKYFVLLISLVFQLICTKVAFNLH